MLSGKVGAKGTSERLKMELGEFTLPTIATAMAHLLTVYDYSNKANLAVFGPLYDRAIDIVLSYPDCDDQVMRRLCYQIGNYYRTIGRSETARTLFLYCLTATARDSFVNMLATSEAMTVLSGIVASQGQDETSRVLLLHSERLLSVLWTINPLLPKLRLKRAHVRFDLACKLSKAGDFVSTRSMLEATIADYEAELGPNANELQIPLGQLAEVYASSELHQQAHEILDHLINMHPYAENMSTVKEVRCIQLMTSKANTYNSSGALQRAMDTCGSIQAVVDSLLGVDASQMADAIAMQGRFMFEVGYLVDAMYFYEEAIAVYEGLQYASWSSVDHATQKLGSIYMLVGRFDMAMDLFERHQGRVVAEFGETADVTVKFKMLVRMFEKANGIDTENGFLGRADPGLIFAMNQEVSDALPNQKKSPGSPMTQTLQDLTNQARDLYLRADCVEALLLQNLVISDLKNQLGDQHPFVAQEIKFLGVMHEKEGNHTHALKCYEQAAQMLMNTLGE
jgi:tetratricopeptide (TPR) repeat protein